MKSMHKAPAMLSCDCRLSISGNYIALINANFLTWQSMLVFYVEDCGDKVTRLCSCVSTAGCCDDVSTEGDVSLDAGVKSL